MWGSCVAVFGPKNSGLTSSFSYIRRLAIGLIISAPHPFNSFHLFFASLIYCRSCISSHIIIPNCCLRSVYVYRYRRLFFSGSAISVFNLLRLKCWSIFSRKSQLLVIFSAISSYFCPNSSIFLLFWLYTKVIGVVAYILDGDLNLELLFSVAFLIFDVVCEMKFNLHDIAIKLSKVEDCVFLKLAAFFELFMRLGVLVSCWDIRNWGLRKA